MIPEHKYAFYYWLKCPTFTKTEFTKIVEAINNVGLNLVDGFDEESQEFCIKVIRFVPSGIRDVNFCKVKNEVAGKRFLRSFQESLGGRLYFNIKRQELKWNN